MLARNHSRAHLSTLLFALATLLALLIAAPVAGVEPNPDDLPDRDPVPQEPVPSESNCPEELLEPCAIDLVTGEMTGPCTGGFDAFYTNISGPTDSNGDDWLETVVSVDLAEKCVQVCVVLDYTEVPTGWTLDFGDSITNNGYGGNAGTGESEAELEILNDRLSLYTRSYGPGAFDILARSYLQLGHGAYKVCVGDQYAGFGQPRSSASTPNGKALFALPDPFDGNSELFIGLNRVISGPGSRIGTGLRRAYITFE